jgi:basic membrane protein A
MAGKIRFVHLAAVLIAGLIVVAACGSGTATPSGGGAKKLKVAFLLPGSTTDQGYNADGQRTADAVRDQLGADVTVTPSVAVPSQTDVYRQYAGRGFDLVIGWGGQFTDGAVAVSKEFPKVKFLIINGTASNGSNLASTVQHAEQYSFVGGFLLAKLSKTNTVGLVGAQCFPGTALTINGVAQGAAYAKPGIKILKTYDGDFEDPIKAQQVAQAMIDQGAGALSGNLNNAWFGVFKAAQGGSKTPLVTEWSDNHQLAADVIASSIIKTQAKPVVQIVKSVQDGTFAGKVYEYGLTADWGPSVSKTSLVPDDVYQAALAVQAKIVSGEIKPKADETCPTQ